MNKFPETLTCPVCSTVLVCEKGRSFDDATAAWHTACTNDPKWLQKDSINHSYHYAHSSTSTGWVDMTIIGPFEITRNYRQGGDTNVGSMFGTRTVITNDKWELENMDYCISDQDLHERCQKYKRLLCLA